MTNLNFVVRRYRLVIAEGNVRVTFVVYKLQRHRVRRPVHNAIRPRWASSTTTSQGLKPQGNHKVAYFGSYISVPTSNLYVLCGVGSSALRLTPWKIQAHGENVIVPSVNSVKQRPIPRCTLN